MCTRISYIAPAIQGFPEPTPPNQWINQSGMQEKPLLDIYTPPVKCNNTHLHIIIIINVLPPPITWLV